MSAWGDDLAGFNRAKNANAPRGENVHPHPRARWEDESRPEAEPGAEAPGRAFGRLRLLSVEDALNAPPREYLLDGLIAPGELSVWWGAPKCGKSFLLLRIAYGMAQGLGLWGREAEAVPVCYVAAEGGHGIKGRIHALRKRMGPAPDFHFIAQAVDLFDPQADLDDLIDAVEAVGARLVVTTTRATRSASPCPKRGCRPTPRGGPGKPTSPRKRRRRPRRCGTSAAP